jgi:hypothetical protein
MKVALQLFSNASLSLSLPFTCFLTHSVVPTTSSGNRDRTAHTQRPPSLPKTTLTQLVSRTSKSHCCILAREQRGRGGEERKERKESETGRVADDKGQTWEQVLGKRRRHEIEREGKKMREREGHERTILTLSSSCSLSLPPSLSFPSFVPSKRCCNPVHISQEDKEREKRHEGRLE